MGAPHDVMKRWFDEVWGEHRLETIDELFPDGCIAYDLGPEPVCGPGAFRDLRTGFAQRFRQVNVRMLDWIERGDQIIARCEAEMTTHEGVTVRVPGYVTSIVTDGKIRECRQAWDFVSMLTGIGAVPPDVMGQALAGRRLRSAD